ncbi:MAG TPA: 50S ribosomal protein L18 [Candidatus Saccharimonadales bacterium]|nr:50S ribosomal protein L18 [Candidatus Saccharimonadales bacterium]
MNKLAHKLLNRGLRKSRVRAIVAGTTERPRLSVFISNRHITAQVIDDTKHKTIAFVSTVGAKTAKGSMTEQAEWVGTEIAKKAKAAKVTAVVFDRGARIYHGRVQALADAARKAGLEF